MIENKELLAAAAAADENTLTALANKGLYKRALKDIEGVTPDIIEVSGQAVMNIGGAQCSITVPFENSRCSCPSRTVCRHILAGILLIKAQAPADIEITPPEPPKQVAEEKKAEPPKLEESKKTPEKSKSAALSASEKAKVLECAEMCSELTKGILIHGLVRATDGTADDLELAAVRCHAAKMADAERMMRDLSGRVSAFAARRASFDTGDFTDKLIKCSEYLNGLANSEPDTDMLGSFRKNYDEHYERLELLPIGQRNIDSSSYTGAVYYFLNADEKAERRFLTYSDIRPKFYGVDRKRQPAAAVWGTQLPISRLMMQKMTLKNAKANEGRLSGSNETEILTSTRVNLNCPVVRRMVCCDFREVAVTLEERDRKCEADTLFLIHPDKLKSYGFDKKTQKLIMNLEDNNGNIVSAEVKYTAESKPLIELLEKVCAQMSKLDGLFYTLLVSAYISEGQLRFYPIEVYDFLDGIELHGFTLPEKYNKMYSYAGSLEKIVQLISAVNSRIESIVLSGLQGAGQEHKKLAEYCKDCGMEGLASLCESAFTAAESYRHSPDASANDVLETIRKLKEYLTAAEKKAGTASALCQMKGE